ncbi:MAG: hypothetical protein EON90_06225 [Brevundimonas sp.]|nr:MAG: hypothetical protein EON90_06225 [Brevundimonas sp.]
MNPISAALFAASLQLAPPAPQIIVVQISGPNLSSEGRAASQAVLTGIQPAYVTLKPSALAEAVFETCKQAPELDGCFAQTLRREDAAAGEVALIAWESEGVLRWLCVGRDERPFSSVNQSVALGPLTDLYRDGESEVLHRAAACLTYAGSQSGW